MQHPEDPCALVSPDAHVVFAVYSRLQKRNGKRKNSLPTAGTIAEQMGLRESEVRALIEELRDARICDYDDFGHARLAQLCPHSGLVPRAQAPTGAPTGAPGGVPELPATATSYELSTATSQELGASSNRDFVPGRLRRPDRRQPVTGNPETWNAHELAWYLHEKTLQGFFGRSPGATNLAAVRSNIASWMSVDGIKPMVIKEMIDIFTSTPANLKPGIPAWKSFVNLRQKLFEAADRMVSAEHTTGVNFDVAYWTGAK